MGTSEDNKDASLHNTPPEEESDNDKIPFPPKSNSEPEPTQESVDPPKPSTGVIKNRGIFEVPDGLDPSTRAAMDEAAKNDIEEEISGTCGHCGRPLNVGRPEAKCVECGMVMHGFCFDGHVIKKHRPKVVSVRITSRDGKLYAVHRPVIE